MFLLNFTHSSACQFFGLFCVVTYMEYLIPVKISTSCNKILRHAKMLSDQ